MPLTPEQTQAIEMHVERSIARRTKTTLQWLALIGFPSIVGLLGTLVVMLVTLPKLVEASVFRTIEQERRAVDKIIAVAATADIALSDVIRVGEQVRDNKQIVDFADNLLQSAGQNIDDLGPFLAAAPRMSLSLRAQKYCVLHFPGARRDLYAVPIDTSPTACKGMKDEVYSPDASRNHAAIQVQYGCLFEGSLKISDTNGLFVECGSPKADIGQPSPPT
jgi:hypothetical protein